MTMVSSINVHHTAAMAAKAHTHGDTSWLELTFASADDEFKLAAFMPIWIARRMAEAINDAWNESETATADPVITWPRPSYHRQATGNPLGIRGEDVLPSRAVCRCIRCLAERDDPDLHLRMVVCPACGNKRCPHASDHRHACTGSNEPGQPGSNYAIDRPWRVARLDALQGDDGPDEAA